ncbi:MAG: MBL fold metallo-hydrolase [Acidobacteriota bacterium]
MSLPRWLRTIPARWVVIPLAVFIAAAPVGAATPAVPSPYVLVLGTAQDAGIPQIAGHSPEDEAARRDPRRRRLVASLLIVDPRSGQRWLIDATPDLKQQVDRAAGQPANLRSAPGRPPLFDAIFLTHAHLGHVTGLLELGREAYAAEGQRVVGSASMARFLSGNAPWDLLLRFGHIRLETFTPDRAISLGTGLTITPIAVPHRAETTDTFGFIIRGPHRSLLYIPDIDKWDAWDRKLGEVLSSVDVAYLDGTFFDAGEVPGRSMAEIPHPFIVETLARIAALPLAERRKVVFTHLNHTNPAADPASAARRRIVTAGCRVAAEGAREDL